MKTVITTIGAALALVACNPADQPGFQQDQQDQMEQGQPGAEEGVQQDDVGAEAPPAQQSAEDVQLTAEVRRAVMDLEGLSTRGDNVQITSQDGQVTLHGEVASQEEKQRIEQAARSVAGVTDVNNQLTVQAEDGAGGDILGQ